MQVLLFNCCSTAPTGEKKKKMEPIVPWNRLCCVLLSRIRQRWHPPDSGSDPGSPDGTCRMASAGWIWTLCILKSGFWERTQLYSGIPNPGVDIFTHALYARVVHNIINYNLFHTSIFTEHYVAHGII